MSRSAYTVSTMVEPKVWFITGTSSGFGRFLTEYLLKHGCKVVATLRRPEALSDLVDRYPSTHFVVVKLDVTDPAEIAVAFATARDAFGRVDVVFNNAGQMINGEVESIDNEDARALFDINFWGAAQVSREAVRFFRDVNQPPGGRLLQVSSGAGIVGLACYGYYCATKFALEGLTEAFAAELDPAWNIKITIIQPGPFRTEISSGNRKVVPPHPAYTNPELGASRWRVALESGSFVIDGDPQKACIAFDKVSQLEDPPLRLPLHRSVLELASVKGKDLMDTAEKYKDWSDDLYL